MEFPSGDILHIFMAKFILGILLFIRVSALMVSGPLFGNSNIEPQVKIALSAVIALVMTVAFQGQQPPLDIDVFAFVMLVFKEVLVGTMIGFSANLMMQAARFAGGLIDFEIGFQTALLFDHNAGVPTLLGEIKYLIAIMVYLFIHGHHHLIEALYASAQIIPVGTFVFKQAAVDSLVRMITMSMIVAVKIASPITVALFLTNLALALLSRVAPQMNVFQMSMHIKAAVGLISLFITVPLVVILIKHSLGVFESELMKTLAALATQ